MLKKLLPVLLIIFIVLILFSCNTPATEDDLVIDSKDTLSHSSGSVLYVANINSHTYHLSSCRFAKSMKEENRYETSDLDFLLSREYTPCKICIKSSN